MFSSLEQQAAKALNAPTLCALAIILVLTASVSAQTSDTSTPDRTEIEAVLKSYESAYEHNDYAGIVKVWPGLENNKKESKKIRDRLDRADISETKLSLQIQDLNINEDTVLAHCKKLENYVQVERSSYVSGDATIGAMPAQRPGPSNDVTKRPLKKSGDVWITLKRTGKDWVIDSMSEKKPH